MFRTATTTLAEAPLARDSLDLVADDPERALLEAALHELLEINPGQILEVMLGTARSLNASWRTRASAYQLLASVFESALQDPELAKAVHRKWIDLGIGAAERLAQLRQGTPSSASLTTWPGLSATALGP